MTRPLKNLQSKAKNLNKCKLLFTQIRVQLCYGKEHCSGHKSLGEKTINTGQ